ncbi:sigma-70 family RNA polymerase sigma factor [Rubritalea tangerina]|uniref:Sigma-70 family RNA polymerase sigma factor n=2 Tax=Rubritalea tangerina TaxID=430798 RepID=A0ABW4ZF13_9BACT
MPHSHSIPPPSSTLKVVDPHDPETLLEQSQASLRAYITSLMSNRSDVDDILQETNHSIIQKKSDFQLGSNFKAWAFKIAYFSVMSHVRDRQRRGFVNLSEETLEQLSLDASSLLESSNDRMQSLTHCIQKLNAKERLLLRQHYVEGKSLTAIAKAVSREPSALHKAISRVRATLKACIEKHLAQHLA